MKARLTKLQSNHTNLRTDEIVGEAVDIPRAGSVFVMTSEPLTEGASFRLIHTTEIKEVHQIDSVTYKFETKNSTYQVEILEGEAR